MWLEGTRILVTGAAGFIGSHLSDRLAGVARELVLVDDFSIGTRENLAALEGEDGVRIVTADVTDGPAMRELCSGVDVVFHLAVSCLRTSLGDPEQSHRINAGGTLRLCEAAHASGVRRFVYCSSSEIYGSAVTVPMSEEHVCRPTTVYGASKLAGEHYALAFHRTHGMPALVVRPFNTYGPREPWQGPRGEVIPRFILRLLQGREPVIYGGGAQTRDFTYVEDTVAGLVAAAACDELVGEAVNVAYGSEASIAQIAKLLAAALGRPELEPRRADARPGDVDRHYADIGKARRLLGYAPQVDLATGLGRTVEWFRAQGLHERAGSDVGDPNW